MDRPVLKNRKVEIDFSVAAVHWNPRDPEYSQLWNAMSIAVPYLEPFLIKRMRQLKDQVPESDVELRHDIEMFNSQEGRHYKLHRTFNKRLTECGYDIEAAEAQLKADYARFWDKGQKFGLAYCEGFETFGPLLSGFFFEGAPDLMADWHEPTCYLWLWHLAEEWEHRTVANYTYKTLYDDYWYRLYGLGYAAVHLFGRMTVNGWRLVNTDLATGAIKGKLRSRVRFAKVMWRMLAYLLPKVVFVCGRRDYDPGRLPTPKNVTELLDAASERYGVLEYT